MAMPLHATSHPEMSTDESEGPSSMADFIRSDESLTGMTEQDDETTSSQDPSDVRNTSSEHGLDSSQFETTSSLAVTSGTEEARGGEGLERDSREADELLPRNPDGLDRAMSVSATGQIQETEALLWVCDEDQGKIFQRDVVYSYAFYDSLDRLLVEVARETVCRPTSQ